MGNFVTSSPNEAIIKSGFSGCKVYVGQTAWRWWVCQQVERLSLELMTIEIESVDAETQTGVRVDIRAVAQVKVNAYTNEIHMGVDEKPQEAKSRGKLNPDSIKLAAQHYLGDEDDDIKESIRRTLEGHQRQILGTLSVESLYRDRASFATQVRTLVVEDLSAMGFALASYVVQKIDDKNDYMISLGKTQTALVKRHAAEGEAQNESAARKKVAEYKASADTEEAIQFQKAHVQVNTQRELEAESDRDLNLKRAAFDREVNRAKAEAASAGPIEDARQKQAIVRERTKQEKVEEEIKLEIADQIVERTKKEKEGESMARLLEQTNHAKSIQVIAEAEATKIRQIGEAEADVVRMKGEAEAKVLETKAQAYQQYGEAAVIQMIVEQLPLLAKNMAQPLSKTDKITFVSNDGNAASNYMGDMTKMLGTLPETVQGLTGFNLIDAVKKLADQKEKKERLEAL